MKYFKIDIKRIYTEKDRIASSANGKDIEDAEYYFDKIGKGEIIENPPIFDYFYLESFDKKKYWEWKLQDIHGFIGVGSIMTGWYISDDLKLLLENFKIAPKYHFYETRLLFKGEKLKYWIFQFPINPLKNYDYEKSEYFLDGNRVLGLKTAEEYDDYDYKIWKEAKKNIEWKNIALIDDFDIVKTMQNDTIISEELKNAIEIVGLKGFEFSELDYEVIIA